MVETNLPIIFLRDVVLLPYNELRIELTTENDKAILNNSELYHDRHLLLVNLNDSLEESIDINSLPKIGIIAKIKSRIELPNGIVRLVLMGIDRVEILNYLINEQNNYEAFVIPTKDYEFNEIEIKALKRIVLRDLNSYIENDSYMSNSVLGRISDITNINKLTDIIVSELPLPYLEKIKYIFIPDATRRLKLIIEDLNKELQTLKLENELEVTLKDNLDEEQRNFVLREKLKIIKEELGDLDVKEKDIDKLRSKLINFKAPSKIIDRLNEEINKYELIPSSSPEVAIVRNYIDWLFNLPWNIQSEDNCDLKSIKKKLDETHYGLDEIKSRILEHIIVKKRTNSLNSPIICLLGPPGTGKTSLAKSIANSLNKKFIKISVGGVNDEAEIIGHRRTYMGSSPGKIIQGLKRAKVNNPVFLIDEVDKLTKDYKGDPASALLSVSDKEQNNIFVDNYIEEEFDLSNVFFILTANDKNTIPEALRDRLEIIELSSYTLYEKEHIAKNYLIPKLMKQYDLEKIKISDNAIKKIIRNYTKESGARELERNIDKIFRKVIVELEETDNLKNNITEKNIIKYLGIEKYSTTLNDDHNNSGIVNALAYTPYGGDILKVSVTSYKGKNELKLTGSLGDVMKESILIAISYIKSNLKVFGLTETDFKDKDFHIHFENGAVPKDGPSAGITIVTAIISLLKGIKISNKISMTGEITLRGNILPIGGLKEKIIAASVNDIDTVYIPESNKNDLEELPKEIKDKLKIVLVKDYFEIFQQIFQENVE